MRLTSSNVRCPSVIEDNASACPVGHGSGGVKSSLNLLSELDEYRAVVLRGSEIDDMLAGLTTGRVTWAQLDTALKTLDSESAVDYLTQSGA